MSTPSSDPAFAALEKQFRKCSPETIQAIYDFKRTRDTQLVPQIVYGITRKYLTADAAETLTHPDTQATLSSLGVDSLTMLEIILDVQDALDLTIEDSELRGLQTLAEVNQLLGAKLAALQSGQ